MSILIDVTHHWYDHIKITLFQTQRKHIISLILIRLSLGGYVLVHIEVEYTILGKSQSLRRLGIKLEIVGMSTLVRNHDEYSYVRSIEKRLAAALHKNCDQFYIITNSRHVIQISKKNNEDTQGDFIKLWMIWTSLPLHILWRMFTRSSKERDSGHSDLLKLQNNDIAL